MNRPHEIAIPCLHKYIKRRRVTVATRKAPAGTVVREAFQCLSHSLCMRCTYILDLERQVELASEEMQ